MGRNTSISLSQHFTDFIDAQVESGQYASASEVIRDGLRLLEERRAKLDRLLAEIQKGEDSGVAEEFDFDVFMEQMHQKHGE